MKKLGNLVMAFGVMLLVGLICGDAKVEDFAIFGSVSLLLIVIGFVIKTA